MGVPSDATGSNGDFAFCYGNDSLGVFKKVDGVWQNTAVGGTYFVGFNNANSQLFEVTTSFTQVVVTNFAFTDGDGLQVEIDGIVQYEGDSFTRTSGTGTITFSETVYADVDHPVKVFVGKYSGTGFAGFTNSNSELFEVTTDTNYVDLTNFTLQYSDLLRVEIDGIVKYEGASHDWTRDVANNRVLLNETASASASSPVKIFVGKYN